MWATPHCRECESCNCDPLMVSQFHMRNGLQNAKAKCTTATRIELGSQLSLSLYLGGTTLWSLVLGSLHPWEAVADWGESRQALESSIATWSWQSHCCLFPFHTHKSTDSSQVFENHWSISENCQSEFIHSCKSWQSLIGSILSHLLLIMQQPQPLANVVLAIECCLFKHKILELFC